MNVGYVGQCRAPVHFFNHVVISVKTDLENHTVLRFRNMGNITGGNKTVTPDNLLQHLI
jgi:hypothetical protein